MTSNELRAWMAAHHWSVAGLAAQLDVYPSTVQRWRSGQRRIPGDMPVRLHAIELRDAAHSDGLDWPTSARAAHARTVRHRIMARSARSSD